MSSHRRRRRRRRPPPESWSSDTTRPACSSMRPSTTQAADDDVLPVRSPASNPTASWVLLSRVGARLADFPSDRITTSAMSRTSKGEEFFVEFEFVEPPGISVVTVGKYSGNVVGTHHDVVLLAITLSSHDVDLFVYQASRRDRPPALLLLPGHIKCAGEIGIISCTSNDDGDSPSFVLAQLRMTTQGTVDVRLFRSGSGQWEAFENMHVRGAKGGREIRSWYWSTDAVVPYGRRRYMIWADYYHGMVIMDLSSALSDSETTTNPPLPPPPPPRLWYVRLPVDRAGDPVDRHGCRGCPKACRSVCVTRYGIKFVSVDTMHWSNFGVGNGHALKWSHRFRITTWSLCEDSYSWKKDLTMHQEEFWDAFDGGDQFPFPHVQPDFPVIDMENPDVVVFRLEKSDYVDADEPRWMIKVDLSKKVLLAATAYSKKMESDGLSGDAVSINSARVFHHDLIPSALPRYMDGGQQA